jgi:hypothetical protein
MEGGGDYSSGCGGWRALLRPKFANLVGFVFRFLFLQLFGCESYDAFAVNVSRKEEEGAGKQRPSTKLKA